MRQFRQAVLNSIHITSTQSSFLTIICINVNFCSYSSRQHRPLHPTYCHHRATISASATQPPLRYAIIGGGVAGLASAWHLLQASNALHRPISIELIDGFGLGSGGSGAAAGLLHPYNARGNLLYKGLEAFQDAIDLLSIAEQALVADNNTPLRQSTQQPIAWRYGLVHPARSTKQVADFDKFVDKGAYNATRMSCVTASEMDALIPGMKAEQLLLEESNSSGGDVIVDEKTQTAGFFVGKGVVLHPIRYLEALWQACQRHTSTMDSSTTAVYVEHTVTSLAELQQERGPYDAIIVAAGAAVECIEEMKGLLPLRLCQGYTLDVQTDDSSNVSENQIYPDNAPSILGPVYLAAHGQQDIVVGATRRYHLTPQEALDQCSLSSSSNISNNSKINTGNSSTEVKEAVDALLPAAIELWPPLKDWKVTGVRSGVRAITPRTELGALPYAGKVRGTDKSLNTDVWLVGGLGARGLLYHAWLGRLIANAVVNNEESSLPKELRRWQQM